MADQKIREMQRRIHRWLGASQSSVEVTETGTLEGLDRDLQALEAEMLRIFPGVHSTHDVFEAMQEQAIFRTVLESVVEGIVVADMEGKLLVFNPAAKALLGAGATTSGPESWSAEYGFFYPDGATPYESADLPLSRAMAGESVDGEELIVRTPGRGRDVHILATARPLWDTRGQQMGAVVVFHDITGAKTVEYELRRAREAAEDASRTKSEFLANMSHEIRTPLTAVLGFSDLLMDSQLNESERLNYIQAVRRNGEHLLALINDVLDISKVQANKLQVERMDFSLHHLLHETASIMQVRAREKALDFRVRYDTPIPAHIQSDPVRVRQILLNLLSNAIKFTRSGQVTLVARTLDAGTPSSRVELEISDTGIGLTEDELRDLFQPFQQASPSTTREYGGTGLGLAICRSLAKALGGEVRARSEPGRGSTFTLTLYQQVDDSTGMVAEHSSGEEYPTTPAGVRESGQMLSGRILLAEDGVDNQLLISTLLRRQGLDVQIAENGEIAVSEALDALEKETPFDLILMDMQMPRLDGYGAAAKLRAKGYTGPILALTAHAMSGERERCLHAGCDDYLTKPISRTVLLTAVEAHVRHLRGALEAPAPVPAEVPGPDAEAPLYSTYSDDPDMEDLVAGFVDRLPEQVAQIRAAARNDELENLRRLAHQLKGAAGGYGFMPVSNEAAALEAAARTAGGGADLEADVQRLADLCARVSHKPQEDDTQ